MPRRIDAPILLCPRCLGATVFPEYEGYPEFDNECIWCEGYGFISLRRLVFEVENNGLDPIAYLLTTTVTTHYQDEGDEA